MVKVAGQEGYCYRFDAKAMQYLLYMHLMKNKPIQEILEQADSEVEAIVQQKSDTPFQFFHEKTLPPVLRTMLKQESAPTKVKLINKAKQRIDFVCEELKRNLKQKDALTVVEKNRQLMRCYRLFDWQYNNNEGYKFLRQNEYQNMSIYHYTLNKGTLHSGARKRLLNKLLRDDEAGINISSHLPGDLKELLEQENSFDALYCAVLEKTLVKLKRWRSKLTKQNDEQLKERLHRLGLKCNTKEQVTQKLKQNQKAMKHLPIPICASSILRFYKLDRPEYEFSSLRKNASNRKGLVASHYEQMIEVYSRTDEENGSFSKCRKKYTKVVNRLLNRDILLLAMVYRYINTLQNTNQNLFLRLNVKDKPALSDLLKSDFPLSNVIGLEEGKFQVVARFNQLTSFMIMTAKDVEAYLRFYLQRYPKVEQRKAFCEQADVQWCEKPEKVPLVELKKEKDRLQNESLEVCRYILEWEKEKVDQWWKRDQQGFLIKAEKQDGLPRLSFTEVLDEDNKELNQLRVDAFHCKKAFEKGSFWHRLTTDRMKKILGHAAKLEERENRKCAYKDLK